LLDWAFQQAFEVDCIDNGQTYPAQLSFQVPTTLQEALQVGVSLSITESSAADVITAIRQFLPQKEEVDEKLQQFAALSSLIQEGGKVPQHLSQVIYGRPEETVGMCRTIMAKLGIKCLPILSRQGTVEGLIAMDSFLSLYPTVVALFEMLVASSVRIPLAAVLSVLPRLQPRLYSISSSSVTSPDLVEISVGVVHAVTNEGVHMAGVCSNYLARLKAGVDRVKISIRTSSFRAPKDIISTPMIMVAAGTGFAPILGFHHVRIQDESHLQLVSRQSICIVNSPSLRTGTSLLPGQYF
jgi:FAD binding domain